MMQKSIQFVGLTPQQFQTNFLNEAKSFLTDLVQNLKPQETETYLTRKQVAELFDVSLGTVKNLSDKGILDEYGIVRIIRYKSSEVEQAIIKLNS